MATVEEVHTVRVSNVSPKATEHDIQDFFSFSGEIEHIELHKDGGLSQTAFVTFKEAQALETALLLSGATVVDQAVTIAPADESERLARSVDTSSLDAGSAESTEELEGQVADVPFEVLQQARSNGQAPSLSRSTKQGNVTKRANKNRPMEMSSKKPVGRFREVIQAPKREVRDPRFESLCGKFDDSRFKKSYSFLYDEELPAERQRLKKDLAKGGEDMEEAQKQLAWIDKELREEKQRRKRADAATQHGSKEREAVKKGKKPFYLKKSEQKKEELVEKYQELKASGKLDKFLEKRRKKNSAKDHRYLPYRRPQA